MTLTDEQFNSIVEDVMTDLPFVEWDRGIEWKIDGGRTLLRIYGWIERQKDDYKDFVLIEIVEKEDVEEAGIAVLATSSAEHSEEISHIIHGDDEHQDCFRLENQFEAPNIIKHGSNGGDNQQ